MALYHIFIAYIAVCMLLQAGVFIHLFGQFAVFVIRIGDVWRLAIVFVLPGQIAVIIIFVLNRLATGV